MCILGGTYFSAHIAVFVYLRSVIILPVYMVFPPLQSLHRCFMLGRRLGYLPVVRCCSPRSAGNGG